MAYLEVSAFKKLKAFFWALQKSGFNLNKIPSRDNEGTPVDKAYCLNLLRSFPDFQGEAFKDANFLVKYLSKPGNVQQILDQFTPAQQIEIMKALEEKPTMVAVTGEQPGGGEVSAEQGVPTQAPDTATGATGMPGLPSAPSISAAGRGTRVIYNIPQAPQPSKPEIAVASKSGAVREAGDPSKLVKATRTGEIAEPGQPSKLVTADSSGRIIGGQGAETPPSKIYIANKSGSVVGERTITPTQRLNWPGFKMPASFTNAAKNFSSAAQRFIGTNLGRIGRSLGDIAGGIGRGIAGPGLTSAYNLLGKAASHGLGAFERLSNPGLRGISGSFVPTGSKKLILGLLGAFFFLVVGVGLIGDLSGTTPSSQAAPVDGGPSYTGGGDSIVSCPLNNGRVSCGSKMSSHAYCNHCGSGYEPYTCPADVGTGRDTAIDVVSSNKLVFLPYIEGASVQWTIDEAGTAIPTSEGGGIAISANTKVGEKSYRIRVVHITSTNLAAGHKVSSGTLIGQYGPDTSHVHITLQENGEFKPADTYFKLCTK